MNPIAILTDFGTRDWYVASMKGVLLKIAPTSPIVDISHQIEAQNICQGNFMLSQCYKEYPLGTVFLGVIDPGVGTARSAIAIHSEGYTFVGPDNGLFSFLWSNDSLASVEIRTITNLLFTKESPSHTFHGRDIFAPAAAHLAAGQSFEKVGPLLTNPAELHIEAPDYQSESVKAQVNFIDHFGNIITNIKKKAWEKHYSGARAVIYKKQSIPLLNTYGEVPYRSLIAYFGSGDYLEIAINNRNAAHELKLYPGEKIKLRPFYK